jgi:predicted metal-binding membrane protein
MNTSFVRAASAAASGKHISRFLPVVGLAGLGWLVLLAFAATGNGAVIRHDRLLEEGPPLWLAAVWFVAGWQVMLAAMMVPASAVAFARLRVGRAMARFAAAYFAVWTVFGLAIFFLDAAIHATVKSWPWLAVHPWLIAGTTLVVAGTYQLSNLKALALAACRRLDHVTTSDGVDAGGVRYGRDCVGASGGLMLVAFALGSGSIFTMGAITVLMVWEVTPWGSSVIKPVGYALIALGVFVLAGPISLPASWRL